MFLNYRDCEGSYDGVWRCFRRSLDTENVNVCFLYPCVLRGYDDERSGLVETLRSETFGHDIFMKVSIMGNTL